MKTKEYGAVDLFRLPAAFMVVAIHTGPFAAWNGFADFLFSYCLCRVAVPFFLITTGFFVLGPGRGEALCRYLKKTLLLYAAATLLYAPVSWYAGNLPGNAAEAFRQLLFDGTFYHLWYFPAALLGCVLTAFLLKRSVKAAILFAVCAYLVGLGGDSYYGLVCRADWINAAYDGIYFVSSYTRNGIFYAPVFLLMGALIYRGRRNRNRRRYLPALAVFLPLLCAEGAITFLAGWQRHNSMYLLLLPVCWCLFCLLLSAKAKAPSWVRGVSMLIYILHPLVIILVRGAAKAAGLTALFVENSFVHYLTVCLVSFGIALFAVYAGARLKCRIRVKKSPESPAARWEQKKPQNASDRAVLTTDKESCRAWIELNLKNLAWNVGQLQGLLPASCKLMPAVKANAYGHGAVEISRALQKLGISDFCVASVEEGALLREAGITGQILVLGYTPVSKIDELCRYDLTQTIVDLDYARDLSALGRRVAVHVGVDTGMHRLGEDCGRIEKILRIFHLPNLNVTGVFSHLCASDGVSEEEREFTEMQIARFAEVVATLRQNGITGFQTHLFGSYGILNYSRSCGESYDYARAGIALYGVPSSPGDRVEAPVTLRPVLSLKAKIACVKTLKKGETAGYGLAYTAKEERIIAVISIGYADGVPRTLSGRGHVLIRGKRAPVIGRICMDQMLVDVTGIADAVPGETAVLIGSSGAETISAAELAAEADTISNEILSRLGSRLTRLVLE